MTKPKQLHYLPTGHLHIYEDWGIEQLNNYLHELELMERGASLQDIGMSERRLEQIPKVIHPKSRAMVTGREALEDPDQVQPGSIAVLQLKGVMRSQSSLSTRGMDQLAQDLRLSYENPNVEGILLETNSGGGEVRAGQMIESALKDSPKAVVVYTHLLASAAIMATIDADEIIASNPGVTVGSIGTMRSLPKGFAKWYNEWYEDMYASKSTRKNDSFRKYLQGDHSGFQSELDEINDEFIRQVARARPITGSASQLEKVFSGATMPARKAKRLGLIDGIGSWNHALKRLNANINRRKNT